MKRIEIVTQLVAAMIASGPKPFDSYDKWHVDCAGELADLILKNDSRHYMPEDAKKFLDSDS